MDEKIKEGIKEFIELYELKASGIKNLNGSWTEAKIKSIRDCGDFWKVTACVSLGHHFDGEHPVKEVYGDCVYRLEKAKIL